MSVVLLSNRPNKNRINVKWYRSIILAGLILTAIALRCLTLHESLWLDELHTGWTIAGSWGEIAERARLGNNSPCYFYLVQAVASVLGVSELSLRLPSVVAGSLLLILAWCICRRWKCSWCGTLIALLLATVDRHHLFYAQEARPYAWVQLLSLVHLFVFVSWMTRSRPWPWTILWIMTGSILFHLHVTTALLFPAECLVFVFSRLVGWTNRSTWLFVLGMGGIGLSCVPAYPLLRDLSERRENWELFVSHPALVDLWHIFPWGPYLLLPLLSVWNRRVITRNQPTRDVARREFEPEAEHVDIHRVLTTRRVAITTCLAWIIVPILISWWTTRNDIAALFFLRYLLASRVALVPLTALLLSPSPFPSPSPVGSGMANPVVDLKAPFCTWFCTFLLVVGSMYWVSPLVHAQSGNVGRSIWRHSAEDWRDPVAVIRQDSRRLPIILRSGLIESDAWYRSSDVRKRQYCRYPLESAYSLGVDRGAIYCWPGQHGAIWSSEERETINRMGGAWIVIRGDRVTSERVRQKMMESFRPLGPVRWKQVMGRWTDRVELWEIQLVRAEDGEI